MAIAVPAWGRGFAKFLRAREGGRAPNASLACFLHTRRGTLRAEAHGMASPLSSLNTFEVFLLVTVWSAISIGVIMVMVVLLM